MFVTVLAADRVDEFIQILSNTNNVNMGSYNAIYYMLIAYINGDMGIWFDSGQGYFSPQKQV